MRVRVKHTSFRTCPAELKALLYSDQTRLHVTLGREYEVYAMSRWRGVWAFQLINDVGYPDWVPAWLFDLPDKSVPDDWICNLLTGEVEAVIGPDFVARDQAAYNKMVELDPDSVRLFWCRVERLRGSEEER